MVTKRRLWGRNRSFSKAFWPISAQCCAPPPPPPPKIETPARRVVSQSTPRGLSDSAYFMPRRPILPVSTVSDALDPCAICTVFSRSDQHSVRSNEYHHPVRGAILLTGWPIAGLHDQAPWRAVQALNGYSPSAWGERDRSGAISPSYSKVDAPLVRAAPPLPADSPAATSGLPKVE